jgi:outer membrane protein OmpA-like peptidoglycan-associated protein
MKHFSSGVLKNLSKGIVFGCLVLAGGAAVWGEQDLASVSQSAEGGRGLLLMPTARTFGEAAFVVGGKALYQRREYPVFWKTENNTDNTTIGALHVTLGLTDYLDVTGGIYGYHDARPYRGNLRYGISDYGLGAARALLKARYPFTMDYPIQLGFKLGAMLDTSEKQMDGMIYRWTRKGTDYEGSLLQTFDLGEKFSLHFEEGYTYSGSKIYDDQWVGAAGIEVRMSDRLSLGLEANNRAFDGVSPQSVFQAGMNPWAYYGGVGNPGQAYYIKERTCDRWKDFFVVAPSLSWRLTDNVALDLGAIINVADQKDPRETMQVAVGLSYGTIIPWLGDSDKDGVRNSSDREKDTPAGYPVDSFGVSLDTDGDGVPDGRDQEKNTPRGAKIDVRGVGIDSDGDKVYDGLDKEPATPAGYPVDRYGVALDDDKDGVPNGGDKELNTPAGYPVDRYGVALDDDRDGVPNGRDRQLDTPSGYPVDGDGVALDGDGDGVPDGRDLEKDTPRGKMVDQYGRALKEKEVTLIQEGFIRLNAVYFDVGKATLRTESNDALNEVVDILKKYPTLRIEVAGHTDNTGSKAKNIKLSQARAQAVLEYLLSHDSALSRSNFTVVGHGPDKPIADNATVQGKQLNRRVEFTVLNKEELQKQYQRR